MAWNELVEQLRARDADSTTIRALRDQLEIKMLIRARTKWSLASFQRSLGEVRFEACLDATIHGRWKRKHAPGPDEIDRALPSGRDRLSDPRWYTGLLDTFQWTEVPYASPRAVFDRALWRRLVDEGRRPSGPDAKTISLDHGQRDAETGDLQPIDIAATNASSVDPTALPADVARTLREANLYAELVACLLPGLEPGHPLRALDSEALGTLTALARRWATLDRCLVRDIAHRKARPRWTVDGSPAQDFWSRAWQADYHTAEHHDEYTSSTEIPDHGTAKREAAQYYQHLSRFRKHYQAAARITSAAVGAAQDRVVEVTLRSRDASVRVPLVWHPAEHPSLG